MRQEILDAIRADHRTVNALSLRLKTYQQRIKRHLDVLIDSGDVIVLGKWRVNGRGHECIHFGLPGESPPAPAKPATGVPQHCDLMAAFYGMRPVI